MHTPGAHDASRARLSQTTRFALRFKYALAFLAASLGHEPVRSTDDSIRLVVTHVLKISGPGLMFPLELTHDLANAVGVTIDAISGPPPNSTE